MLLIVQVTDTDAGTNGEVDFSLDPTVAGLFALTDSGPFSASLYLTHTLDRESRTSYSFSISAVDKGSPRLTGQTQVTINVVVSLNPSNIRHRVLALYFEYRMKMIILLNSMSPP